MAKLRRGALSRTTKVGLVTCILSLLVGSGVYGFFFLSASASTPTLTRQAFPLTEPTLRYGLAIDTLQLSVDTIQSGQTLSDLFAKIGVPGESIYPLSIAADSVMDLRALRAGKEYTVIDDADTEGPDFLVYQPSVYEYIRLDLQGTQRTERVKLPVVTEIHEAAGVIESSLWNAMVGNGHSFELTDKMENALQWSIDFHHVQPNDAFKLVYEKDIVNGEEAAVGPVKAAYYRTTGREYYAFYFDDKNNGELSGYYDQEGRPMKATFLKAPVKYGRMSSAFNLRRFHPVLKRTRPHYGTDYAAPYGTPILAVGDGVVVEATRRGGNGNFVKLRHNKRIQTQYLHMQRFGEGIRPGTHVQQGQVIGYVGSTGLATGPHVCFRYWQDGKQVDHTKLELPPAQPLPDSLMPEFLLVKNQLMLQLETIQLPVSDSLKVATP